MTNHSFKPAISIQELSGDAALQIVHSYGKGGFRITKAPYDGSQFILPRHRQNWAVQTAEDISLESVLSMLGPERPDLLLLGLGIAPMTNLPKLSNSLYEVNVRLEVMSTPAACRTWNVLVSEGRSVAAGLLAID